MELIKFLEEQTSSLNEIQRKAWQAGYDRGYFEGYKKGKKESLAPSSPPFATEDLPGWDEHNE